jgi:nucleotidyltransferase substrate binding protein (TIGR01987 family)
MMTSHSDFHLANFRSALVGLDRALVCPKNEHELVIDGTIQRFEYCFELCWKAIRETLALEGLEANSPKETLRQAFAAGWIKDETLWLNMLEDRNLTSHTYFIDMAERVYNHIAAYYKAMTDISVLLSEKHS